MLFTEFGRRPKLATVFYLENIGDRQDRSRGCLEFAAGTAAPPAYLSRSATAVRMTIGNLVTPFKVIPDGLGQHQ